MSYRKDIGIIPIITGLLLVVIATVVFIVMPNFLQPTTDLRLGDGIFKARLAANEKDRAKGLTEVTKLNSDQALLMIFPNQDKWEIQINDMKVPVDIVWLDSNKKVVYIVNNATPGDSILNSFKPRVPAKYVVEMPSGTVKGKAISTNSVAIFQTDIKGI